MDGHETHCMDDGTEHDARFCPDDCSIRQALALMIEQLDSGEYAFVRVQ